MSREEVDAAVERIGRRDRSLRRDVEAAADFITAGEGMGQLSQAEVQEALWWRLPRTWPAEQWPEIVAGAAALFDEIGLARYAAIARSETTAEILDTWAMDPGVGNKVAEMERSKSGVVAPNTDGLVWGSIFGADESDAIKAVERALEAAIVDGSFVPGGRGSKRRAAAIAHEVVNAPLDFPPGQTLMTLVTTERVGAWIHATRVTELAGWRTKMANRLLRPIEPPDDVAPVIASMQWLLGHAREGIALTERGYLPRALVVDAVERFGWWDHEKPPRSESDVLQITDLREAAARLRLIKKKGRTLSLTVEGRANLDDPVLLWRRMVTSLGGASLFDQMVAELVALRLLDGPAPDDELIESVVRILAAQGWRTPEGPFGRPHIDFAVWDCRQWWRALGVWDSRRARWDSLTDEDFGQSSERLTEPGAVMALAYLQQRATGPRDELEG